VERSAPLRSSKEVEKSMRTFEHFPDVPKLACPICGTNEDSECILVGIDGTADGNNEQAQPVHTNCLRHLRYLKEKGIIYAVFQGARGET